MAGLLEFLNTPQGLGLLSGVAGYAAGARRGTPVNNIGRGLVTGLSGYASAQDQLKQESDNALAKQFKQLQMDQIQRTLDQQKAQDAWKAGLPGVMAPKLTGTTDQGQQLADQQAAFGPEGVQSLADSAQYAGQNAPLGMNYGPDKQAVQDYMMQPSSPYADKIIENQFMPKPDKFQAVGDTLLKIGGDGGVKPVYSGPKKAPEGMQYDANGQLGEIPGYVAMRQKIAAAGRAPQQPAQPYYSPVQTANGVMAFNARTGRMEPIMVNGQTVVGSQSDPTLQGGIAQSKAAGKTIGESRAQAGIDLPNAIAQGQQTVKLVDDLLKAPGFSTAVGTSSKLDPRNYVPGTDAYDFRVRLDQIKGQQFMQAYQTLKGGGQITEVEGKKATDAISRMNTASSEDEFKKAATEFKTVINAGLQRARMRAGVAGSQAAPASAPALPDGWSVQEHQ